MSAFPVPVVSGVPYVVAVVDGQTPSELTDFEGLATFVIDTGQSYTVAGEGTAHGAAVRFHEKASDGVGKDVRVWSISRLDDGSFVAVHVTPM